MLAINDQIEDLKLKFNDGSNKLSDLEFKYAVIYFYPKDNTSGCTLQANTYNDLLGEFSALDTIVIGVSKDSLKSHTNFINKYGLNFYLASDDDLVLNNYFDVYKEKSMYGRKYMGTVRSSFVIDRNLKVLKANYNVKAGDDPKINLEFIKTLE